MSTLFAAALAPARELAPAIVSRTHLLALLSTPDIAVLALGLGVLLLFLEANLPGAVLPGAVGLTLLLSGLYGLSLHPLRPAALLLLAAAGLALLFSARTPLRNTSALAGTLGLVFGLLYLTDTSRTHLRVHPRAALPVGLLVGLAAALLGRIAHRARRNKAIQPVPHGLPSLPPAAIQSRSSVD